jgi:hypothetical protein
LWWSFSLVGDRRGSLAFDADPKIPPKSPLAVSRMPDTALVNVP